jgi:hypothetical protein
MVSLSGIGFSPGLHDTSRAERSGRVAGSYLRARGLQIMPSTPYFKPSIESHLLSAESRGSFPMLAPESNTEMVRACACRLATRRGVLLA